MKRWLRVTLVLFTLLASCGRVMPQQAYDTPVVSTSSRFCPPFSSLQPAQRSTMIPSGDVRSLLGNLRTVTPGTTLLLADGIYTLAAHQTLGINTPRVTIRSASGNRDAVIIEGGYNNVSISADDVAITDLTLRNAKNHSIQVHGEKGIKRPQIYNVHLRDSGQQFVKVSTSANGTQGKFADDGLVACSLIEYTTYSRGNGVTAPSYTNGIDILAGKGWIVRDNVLRRIRSQAGPVGPSIYLGRNSADSVIQRNLLVDCWRGIALGLYAPDKYSRGGPTVLSDHQNGLVENNVFLALHEPADAAIENNYAVNSRIVHNTAYYNETIQHAVHWAIEYRFSPTAGVLIQNNLTNRPIIKRKPYPAQDAIVEGNMTNAVPTWFRDLAHEDFHLTEHAPAIDAGVQMPATLPDDIDGDKRPIGQAPDAGADEYVGLSLPQERPAPVPR